MREGAAAGAAPSSLRRSRGGADLLHQGSGIDRAPMFRGLIVLEPDEVVVRDLDLLPTRRDPHEIALVGPADRRSDGQPIALDEDVLKGEELAGKASRSLSPRREILQILVLNFELETENQGSSALVKIRGDL